MRQSRKLLMADKLQTGLFLGIPRCLLDEKIIAVRKMQENIKKKKRSYDLLVV